MRPIALLAPATLPLLSHLSTVGLAGKKRGLGKTRSASSLPLGSQPNSIRPLLSLRATICPLICSSPGVSSIIPPPCALAGRVKLPTMTTRAAAASVRSASVRRRVLPPPPPPPHERSF